MADQGTTRLPVNWTHHCCAWAFPHRAKIKAAEDSLAVKAGRNSGTTGACTPENHLRLFQKIPQPIKSVISNTSTLDGKREANNKETWTGSDFLTLSVEETFQQLVLKVCSHIVPGRDRAEPKPRGEPPMHLQQLEMADIIVAEERARLLVKVPVSHWSQRAVLWRQWSADPQLHTQRGKKKPQKKASTGDISHRQNLKNNKINQSNNNNNKEKHGHCHFLDENVKPSLFYVNYLIF